MTLFEYQQKAKTFNGVPDGHQVEHALYGLVEEVGELMGLFKRIERGDVNAKERFDNEFTKELGDILWYVSDIATLFGVNMDIVASENIQKLEDRKARNVIKGSGDR